jgi:hypothetical protein
VCCSGIWIEDPDHVTSSGGFQGNAEGVSGCWSWMMPFRSTACGPARPFWLPCRALRCAALVRSSIPPWTMDHGPSGGELFDTAVVASQGLGICMLRVRLTDLPCVNAIVVTLLPCRFQDRIRQIKYRSTLFYPRYMIRPLVLIIKPLGTRGAFFF